jgi:hypothetical protein
MDALKSDPLSLLYILTSAMGVGIFRGALKCGPYPLLRAYRLVKIWDDSNRIVKQVDF